MIEPKKIFEFRKEPSEGETTIFSWSVPKDLPYLDGHFPGNPIVPAVAMIDASLEAIRLELALAETPYLKELRSAKFTSLVTPGLTMRLELNRQESRWTILWKHHAATAAQIILDLECD